MHNIVKSRQLFEKAQHYLPGGVNSPVRAFKAVGGTPIFIKAAKGPYLYDEDGNSYLDLINAWGPMILGHAHEVVTEAVAKAIKDSFSFGTPHRKEVEIATLITAMVPSIEKVRMVNAGTEATMSAIRLARGYTGKDKIIKFEGCYHGHSDAFLIEAGSGAITMGVPSSPGVPGGTARDTLNASYGNLQAVEEIIAKNKDQIAAIIIEPVSGNMGCIVPPRAFLQGLRTICDQEGILLIFDEVMTGFRLARGGAQELFGILPDLTTLGKIIGGGMPVGAYGGKKEIMDFVSPAGPVFQAGTLSGNPIAMAAGCAMLRYLYEHPAIYRLLEDTTQNIVNQFQINMEQLELNYTINHIGSMFSLFFTENEVKDFKDAQKADKVLFGKYFHAMLQQGVYWAPSQFEVLFVSTEITPQHADQIAEANYKALAAIHECLED
ncbi:MAG: glutamate-1-semialdehyde 2,1-aminomutase [Cytophagales bacterium]|nr:glutamate-1-semialdehyde 2,1-aminomutase [Cytophagales bacterium]